MMKYLLIFGLFILSSCATTKHKVSELPTIQWEEGIYDIRTGEKISEEELWSKLADTQFVLVGESHDSADDHAIQIKVIERLGADNLVGFEMFQRPFQPVLDRYSKGELSEEELLTQTEWKKRWGFKTELYSPIWNTAKKVNADIIALNVRKELTKRVSSQGLDGLTELEKKDIVEVDLSNTAYKKWLAEIFAGHGAKLSNKKLDRFYQAQVLWDETMADSAVKALDERKKKRIILIVGRGHFEWDWGIPSRIRRRSGALEFDSSVKVLIPSDGDLPSAEDLKKKHFADFVWIYKKKAEER